MSVPREGWFPSIEAPLPDPAAGVRGRHCVITGGAGFIGARLCDLLANSGARSLRVIDDLRTGSWSRVQVDVERVERDLATLDAESWRSLLRGDEPGVIFHLAAEKHRHTRDAPERLFATNVNATEKLLRAASVADWRVVSVSSLYAYGRTRGAPMDEPEPLYPDTLYGISKQTGERLVAHFARNHGLRASIARPFFVYGPRQFEGAGYKSVLVTHGERLLRGEAPVVRGDGLQRLDYVYVDDVCDGLIRLAHDALTGATLNIASGQSVSILELTKQLCLCANVPFAPVFADSDETAGTDRCGRNERLCATGWRPQVPFAEGIARTWQWLREHATQ